MNKAEIVKQLEELGLVPVVRASSADEALQVIEAIKAGGVNVLEITMTVPGAVRVIEKVADKYGSEVLVGAGTVLDPETARACLLAGAQFIVSPALNLDTIAMCHRYSAPVMPGVLTPTEVLTAWSAGADFVKTSTGFSKGGATVADVALMRRTVGSELGVKASGGVKGLEDARKMVEAGATRIGASVGVKIAQEAAGKSPTPVITSAD